MELTEELKAIYVETAKKLKGSDRRKFMAQITKELGSQYRAEKELKWNRYTDIKIIKFKSEYLSGQEKRLNDLFGIDAMQF